MKLTWFGHAAFLLETAGSKILIDPFLSGNPANSTSADSIEADVIALTHAHGDHFGDTLSIAKRTNATVIAVFELVSWLSTQGLSKLEPFNLGGTVPFEGGSVKAVPAWHTNSFETPDGTLIAPGVPAGLVFKVDGKTLYFAGDTALFSDMSLIAEEDLDLAVLPIGDRFTMGPADAARAAGILRAGTVIPCHYNTFPAIEQDGEAFKQTVESETNSKVLVLSPGETVEI